jgi:hypothetical protein
MPVRELRGCLPDPADVEYKSFTPVHTTFVNRCTALAADGNDYDIPHQPPAYDQLGIGSCVLNSVVGAMSIVLSVEHQAIVMLSRLWLYFLCSDYMGTLNDDKGTYPWLAVDRVGKIGCCRESTWPYGPADFMVKEQRVRPKPACYTEASDNKATAWFRIDASGAARLNQMEASIRSDHPIIFGTPCASDIRRYQAGEVMSTPDMNDIIGRHAMVFTGVRYLAGRRVWVVRNSWGFDYGDNGYLLLDDAWASWAALEDLWLLTRMDSLMF